MVWIQIIAAQVDAFYRLAGLAETLESLGVSEEVKTFVLASGNQAAKYIALLKTNPQLTVEELQAAKPEVKSKPKPTEKEIPAELMMAVMEIAKAHPKNKKQTSWILKQLEAGERKEDLIPTLDWFWREGHRLPNKDLNSYTGRELEKVLKDLGTSARQEKKQQIAGGSKKIWEDDNWTLYRIDSKAASQTLGRNTKWCITGIYDADPTEDGRRSPDYYSQYVANNVIFYFLLSKHPTGGPIDKIAFAYQRDAENNIIKLDVFDSLDEDISYRWERSIDVSDVIGSLMEADARTQPKSILARIGNGEASEEDIKKGLSGQIEGVDTNTIENVLTNCKKLTPETWKYLVDHRPEVVVNLAWGQVINSMPEELMAAMIDKSIDFAVRLANSDTELPPDILIKLSQNEQLRIDLSLRSDLPLEVVLKLIKSPSQAIKIGVLDHSSRDFMPQLENILVRDENSLVRCRVAEFSKNPTILQQLSDDKNVAVLVRVVSNPHTTWSTIEHLLSREDENVDLDDVYIWLARRNDLSDNIKQILLQTDLWPVISELLFPPYEKVNDKDIIQLLDKNKGSSLFNLTTNKLFRYYKNMDESLLNYLIKFPLLWTQIANRGLLPVSIQRQLLQMDSSEMNSEIELSNSGKMEIAQNSSDPEVLRRLAQDSSPLVRSTVASNSNAYFLLPALLNDSNNNVRRAVASNKTIKPGDGLLEKLFELSDENDIDILHAITYNNSSSQELLNKIKERIQKMINDPKFKSQDQTIARWTLERINSRLLTLKDNPTSDKISVNPSA